MVWDPTLYTVVGLAGTALFLFIAAVGWQYRSKPAAKAFVGLLVALGGWIGLYAVGLGFTSLAEQLAWQRTALAIGGFVPTFWFLFAVQYTNRNAWLTRPVKALLILDPLLFGLLTLTNPSHGMIWRETALEHGSGLGLWLVQWIATAAGGDVEFADREPCGTVVTLTLPTDPSPTRISDSLA